MKRDGALNTESASRVSCAASTASRGSFELIITCGWAYRRDSQITIAQAMKKHLREHYPCIDRPVFCQDFSRDTVGDAVFTRLALRDILGINNCEITVVTSDYHLTRAIQIFDFVFGKHCFGVAASSNRSEKIERSEEKSLNAFRRTLLGVAAGDLDSMLRTISLLHPFYNGEVHDKIEWRKEIQVF